MKKQQKQKKWQWTELRFSLHFGMAIGVLLQLFSSQMMSLNTPEEKSFFECMLLQVFSLFFALQFT